MANNLLHGGTTNDEGFKSLSEELFEQIFRANPDMSLNGTVIAAINAKKSNAEILEQHVKDKDEDEDLTAQMVEAGETILSESARQAEELRRHQEAWDNAPSSEYPGMTNKDVLAGLQLICGNLPYYTDMAVKKGWIKEEDKDKFAKYLLDKEWLKQQERDGKTNTPEYIAKKEQFEIDDKNNPSFKGAAKQVIGVATGYSNSLNNDQGQTANLQTGSDRIAAGGDALNIDSDDGQKYIVAGNNGDFSFYRNSVMRNPSDMADINRHPFQRLSAQDRINAVDVNRHPFQKTTNQSAYVESTFNTGNDGFDDIVSGGALKTSGLSLTNEFNKEAPNATPLEPIKTADANNMVQLNQVKPAQFTQSNGMI